MFVEDLYILFFAAISNMKKSTLVWGASNKPHRYAYRAVSMLKAHDHPVFALGRRAGEVLDTPIVTDTENLGLPATGLDTLTLYINPRIQAEVTEEILALKPKRVIFNPGTENPELARKLEAEGVKTLEACTLVMLSTGQY